MLISRRVGLARIFLGGLVSALLLETRAHAQPVQYSYDALGRLTGVTYGDGTTIAYSYDALGNRVTVTQTPPSPPPPPPFTATIAITGSGPVNLRTLADSAGYTGAQAATVHYTLASGVTITGAAGAPNGGAGIDTGSWPTGGYSIALDIAISGIVYGGGGKGGQGAQGANAPSPGSGGDAINCQVPISIVVNSGGQVKAGGGGGGGGGGWVSFNDVGGGGGGGGYPNGPGGAGGLSDAGANGANGSVGTTSGGGAGGAGGSFSSHTGGAGAIGGGVAASGSTGSVATGSATGGWAKVSPASGAAPGNAIRKNGNTVTVTNNGTITGAVG